MPPGIGYGPGSLIPRIGPQALSAMQQQIQPRPSGLSGLLDRPGVREGLLMAGLRILASDDRQEHLGTAIADAASLGIGTGRQAAQRQEYESMLEGAPPQMQAALKLLGPEQGAALLARQMMMPPPEQQFIEVDGALVTPDGAGGVREVYRGPTEDEPPSDIRSFEEYMKMGPAEQEAYLNFLRARTASQTVNVGGPQDPRLQALAEQEASFVTEGFEGARTATDKVDTIRRLTDITKRDAFQDVSGPIGGRFGEMKAFVTGDTEALEALAEFEAGSGLMTMAQLEAFTGPKTDFEFRQAQRLAFSDPTMTPEQIRAGLDFHRRVAEQEAVRWADRMLELAPSYDNPAVIAPQLDLARQIKSRFGTANMNDPAGIR